MHVVATAGHVDHGKSTLVRALTSIDPDRLAEEKARGLTIDLGFAWTVLPSGRGISFIDVPGHIRFIRNMLAGVGSVDAVLFVVSAPEGWKPQSEEHLRILQTLGVEHGVVVLTQIGLVDHDLHELALLDVEEHLEGTFLSGAEVVSVDSLDGTGLDELRAALDRLTAATPTARDLGRPRMWIDRSFSPRGAGTVVTGTLTGGELAVDGEVLLMPGGKTARIRAIQSLGRSHQRIGPGNRVALNLSGVDTGEVGRGDVVVLPGQWFATSRVDASLDVLGSLDHEVSRRGAYAMYLGSGEFPVKMRVLGPDALLPSESGRVRLHLPTSLPLLPRDRFVLREFGRDETVGGGMILDVDPVLTAARARPDLSVERVVEERGWIEADKLRLLTGSDVTPTLGAWVGSPRALADLEADLRDRLERAGPLGLDLATVGERGRLLIATFDGVVIEGGRARQGEVADPLADHPVLDLLNADPFSPPEPEGATPEELRALVQRGLLVQVEGRYFTSRAVDAAARVVAGLLARDPGGFTVAQARDALSTTRKHALPLLARLDATGVTRRRGDLRVAGPRLPDPD